MDVNRFNAFVGKEFLHILRDRWTLLVVVGIPIALLLLFGFAITTEVKNVQVAVFDPSNDEMTTQIIQQMDAGQYFNISERLNSIDRINDVFREGKVNLVMVFSEDFSSRALAGEDAGIQLMAHQRHTTEHGKPPGHREQHHDMGDR